MPGPKTTRARYPRGMSRAATCLTTPRLLLRELSDRDLTALFEIHSDPKSYALDSAQPIPTMDRLLDVYHVWRTRWEEDGVGYRTVLTRASEETIGLAGVKRTALNGQPVLNLYYRLRPTWWGRGYATEAVEAVLAHDAVLLPDLPVMAQITGQNEPSQRLAERVGLHRTDLTERGDPHRHLVYLDREVAA